MPELIELLQCPTCHSGSLIHSNANRTGLSCTKCSKIFDIKADVFCFMDKFDDYTENYDQICNDDLKEPKTPEIVKQIVSKLVIERAKGVTCDLGCGDGYVIRQVPTRHRVAVDIAFSYLERLPSILKLWCRVEEVPLQSKSIDTIICTDVIEHVLDAQLLADEIDRLLAPTGQLLLAFPFEQDLSVYDLPEYKARFGKYKYVHLRSMNDATIADLFPHFRVQFSKLITEGMKFMVFKPYPIKFVQLIRTN
jgi:SAM-dependent methyltransferase